MKYQSYGDDVSCHALLGFYRHKCATTVTYMEESRRLEDIASYPQLKPE
jgi:hypothetical protein